ncbi:MAG: type II secretion system protein [Terriglobales bacterium]
MKLRSRARQRGFTLIEMLIVIVVMGVLLALAVPSYNTTIIRSKEARLHHNLVTLNNLIQQYSLDKKKAPQQLQDLVDAGYLKFIPDDITGSNTTWQTEQEDPEKAWNPDELGITSVHSGSDQTALDGSAYSGWIK